MSTEALTAEQIAEAGLDGWALLTHYGISRLHTRIHTLTYAVGRRLVNAIGEAAEHLGHHADLDLRADRVDVRLDSGEQVGGVAELDVRLARRISELVAAAGVELEGHSVTRVELGLDTPDHERIAPFWAAVLGSEYVANGPADLSDPWQVLPLVYFQRSGSEEPRQRWHLDVFVDPAQVRPRIDAALAAGGTLVSDERAPAYWTLADPDGNKVCLCL